MDDYAAIRVTFPAGGLRLAAHLYRPAGQESARAAVVVGGSLTAVKEQMIGIHARALAERGYFALALDFAHYGESGGSPRQFEDPQRKAADVAAAADYLASLDEVDGTPIAGVGVCTAGGTMLYAAGRDTRLGAIASVAGHLAEPAVTPDLYGGTAGVQARREAGRAARLRWEREGVTELIQAYSNVNENASHIGPMPYYMDQRRGGGVPQWLNGFAVMSWEPWLDFDCVTAAAQVETPTLLVHTDECALPEQARRVAKALRGPTDVHWTTGEHFDFYDNPTKINEAADAVDDFFQQHLAGPR